MRITGFDWTTGTGISNFWRVNNNGRDQIEEAEFNGSSPVEIRPLTKDEYLATMRGRLANVTAEAEAVVDVWAYVYEAGPDVQVSPDVFFNRIVTDVFRTEDGRHDQVLIPSIWPNVYVAIIVNRAKRRVHGHYLLDFNAQSRR